MRDLQSFGRRRGSLKFQGEHAGAEGQVVELQSLAEHSKEEGSFRQRVGGYLRLPARRHLALLTLGNNDVRAVNLAVSSNKQIEDDIPQV